MFFFEGWRASCHANKHYSSTLGKYGESKASGLHEKSYWKPGKQYWTSKLLSQVLLFKPLRPASDHNEISSCNTVNPLLSPPLIHPSPFFTGRKLISPPLPSPNYSSLVNERLYCKTLCGLIRDGLFTNWKFVSFGVYVKKPYVILVLVVVLISPRI